MSRWFWASLAAIFVLISYFYVRNYRLERSAHPPIRVIPRINPTAFDQPEQIGAVVYRVLRAEFRDKKVVLLGSFPTVTRAGHIWDGFLREAYQEHFKFGETFQLQGLPEPQALTNINASVIQDVDAAFFNKLEKLGQNRSGQMAIAHLLTSQESQLVQGSFGQKLSKALSDAVLSISILPMTIHRENLAYLQPRCEEIASNRTALQPLGCAAFRLSQKAVKKSFPSGKYVAALDRYGPSEFLLFVYQP